MDIISQTTPDLAQGLPPAAFYELMRVLRGALPAPAGEDPADWERRDLAAIAAVTAMQPANAAEGLLAAEYVTANAWAMDCTLLARERRREPGIADKCKAQAMGMLREGKKSLRALERMQAARRATEADPAAAERAAWIEHGVGRMMEAALYTAADEPVADEETEEFHTERQEEETQEAVSGVGPVSHPAINPQDTTSETKTGLGDWTPDEGSKARGSAPWTPAKGPPLESIHCLGVQGGPTEAEQSTSRPSLHSQTSRGF